MAYGDESDLAKVFEPSADILTHVNNLLQGNDNMILEQCFWFIANVCGESHKFRDYIIQRIDIYKPMLRLISS